MWKVCRWQIQAKLNLGIKIALKANEWKSFFEAF